MQISAAKVSGFAPSPATRPAVAGPAPVDLTKLAVAKDNVKMAVSAGAALDQVNAELSGVLVNISA